MNGHVEYQDRILNLNFLVEVYGPYEVLKQMVRPVQWGMWARAGYICVHYRFSQVGRPIIRLKLNKSLPSTSPYPCVHYRNSGQVGWPTLWLELHKPHPDVSTTDENIELVDDMIKVNKCITINNIAQELGIGHG